MEYMFWVWLAVVVVTAVAEFATMELVSIWFTAGAIPSLIMSAVGGVHWAIQISVFIVLSAVLLLSLRRVTKRFLLKNANEKTNLETIVGKKYKLISEISPENPGSVKINGVVWSAVSENENVIAKDQYVEIVKISGNKLIVKQIEEDK